MTEGDSVRRTQQLSPNSTKEILQQLKQTLQHNGRCRSFRPILYAVTALQSDDFPLRDNLSWFEVVSRYVRSSQWQGFLNW
jgi:hypothetical protein